MSVAGNDGQCCECAALVGCDCITSVPCSLTCEKKTGSATLCGFAEWTNPSDPRKLYRRCTAAGYTNWRSVCNSTCSGCGFDVVETFSGEAVYDVTTCIATNAMQLSATINGGSPTLYPLSAVHPSIESFGAGTVNFTQYATPTVASNGPGSPACRSNGGSGWAGVITATATKTFSDEDTETDAEARAAAAISNWTGCGGDCGSLCSAYRSDRSGTSDVIFGFRVVQTKVQWTAIVGRSYAVIIYFARRLLGSGGPFLDLGMVYEVTSTPSSINGETDWVEVPNEAGWETVAYSCGVTLLPL